MTWLRHAGRFIAVLSVIFVFLILYGAGLVRLFFIRDPQRRQLAKDRLLGRTLRRAMTLLGATFIKFGQVMSTRPDLFPPAVIQELRRLQDDVPPFSAKRARQTLELSLGAPIATHFASFDDTCLAAASVAQVHRATLHDGTEVAIKILRPKIREKAKRDGAILVGLAKLLSISKTARMSEPVAHARHFVEGIIGQTNLENEARNYKRFKADFAGHPQIIFPEVFPDLSTDKILTMSLMRGAKVDAINPKDHPDIARTIRDAFLGMCFEHGFVHADMHPGNLLIMEDSRLCILDVGLVKEISDDLLIQFIDLVRVIAMGHVDDLVAHLKRFHTYLGDIDWPALTEEAEDIVTRFRGQDNSQLEWGAFMGDILALARRYHLRPMPELALVMVGLMTVEGIGKMLEPDRNTFTDLALFIAPIAMKRGLVTPEDIQRIQAEIQAGTPIKTRAS